MSVVPADQAVEASKALVATVRAPGFMEQVSAALPEGMPAHRFVRSTVTALLANPDLALSDHASVLNALMRSAQDGLVPDGREAAIVLYKGKASYLPMISGYRKIAAEHGWSIVTRVVYQNDTFEHELGIDEKLIHRPTPPGQTRGDLFAAYAVGKHRDGRREIEVMYADDIQKRRRVSRYGDRGPWVEWPERMWEKTVGKALFSKLPLDPGDRRVVSMLTDGVDDPVTAVYGHRPVAGELPPERPQLEQSGIPPVAGDTTPRGSGGGQQAGGGTTSAGATAAPDPDPEPQVEPPAEPEPVKAKAPTLAQARKVVLPSGVREGKTLAEVAQEGGAVTFFGWALRHIAEFPPELAAAIEVVAKADVPDAWQQVRGSR